MVESNGDLHVLVPSVRVAGAQEYDLVMMRHVIVRYRDGGRSVVGVDEPVVAIRQRAVVNPYVLAVEDRHAVTVRHCPHPVVPGGVPYHGVAALLAVVDVDAVDDDVGGVVDGDARPVADVDAGSSPVDGLEGVHDQLVLEPDHHVPLEYDPEGLVLDHGVPQGARPGVHRVVVARVRDNVDPAVFPPEGVLPEPNSAVGQALPVALPVRVAPPAVIDWVAGAA